MMACTSPLTAHRSSNGQIVFGSGPLRLACGQCMGCRLERSRQWAIRCVHESKFHVHNCFLTLTYDDVHIPDNHNLCYRDFQLFMKKLRRQFSGKLIRFYMCGEYGENTHRPHYHACIFGIDFDDKVPFHRSSSNSVLYRSDLLDKLWSMGHASIGELTFESAAYTSRYITKKLIGSDDKSGNNFVNIDTGEVFERVPEFTRMSLKPGIGRPFYDKFKDDMLPPRS